MSANVKGLVLLYAFCLSLVINELNLMFSNASLTNVTLPSFMLSCLFDFLPSFLAALLCNSLLTSKLNRERKGILTFLLALGAFSTIIFGMHKEEAYFEVFHYISMLAYGAVALAYAVYAL